MSEPENPALENGPRGDLGRRYDGAEPVVDNALANLMQMVQREEAGE